jgi:hypothetical protein
MIRIRHRTSHDLIADVSDDQTPKWFIGVDGSTYGKDQWELAPPPGQWEDITRQVILDVKDDGYNQGRVNVGYNESGAPNHIKRIGYIQFKGPYRLAQGVDGLFRVERRKDTDAE